MKLFSILFSLSSKVIYNILLFLLLDKKIKLKTYRYMSNMFKWKLIK